MNVPTYYERDPHQDELFEAARENLYTDGVFVSPTGSGKTFVIGDTIYERAVSDGGQVFVVLVPKIQLAMQQVKALYDRLEATNGERSEERPFRYTTVHSGNMGEDHLIQYARDNNWNLDELPNHQFTSTTSSTDLRSEVNKADNSGENLVIVSTYHSAERIAQAGIDVDHVFCDEAHYLVEAQHHHVLNLFDAPYHHWTATPRYSDSSDGRGMNNTDAYGNVLQRITMERLVEEGLLAKPRLNLVRGMGTNESSIENKYSVIKTIADNQEQKINYPPKLVFNCSGRDQLHGLAQLATEDGRFEDWTVYHISSKDPNHADYGSWIDDREVDRSTWMEEIDEEDGKALVFHYDVVTEGIDVPGISATSMFRSIGSTGTVVQIMGRALRLLSGERGIPVDRRKKTHADIYVPLIEEPFDDGQDLVSQFEVFRNLLYKLQAEGINIDPSEIRMVEQATGDGDDEEDTLEVTEGEEIDNLLPDDIDDLTDVVNEEYENVQKDERQTYLNRMRVNSDSVTEAIDFFEQDRDTILQEREKAELLLEHIYNQQDEENYPSNHEITSSTYTPPTLAHNQIEKLVEAGTDFSNAKVLVLNPEYLVQLYREGFRPDEVVILCDDPAMRNAVSRLSMRFGILGQTVNEIEQLDDMEFDVVVGNPPYQKQVGPDKTEPMWGKFVTKTFALVKDGGYISLVHPSGWRAPSGRFTDQKDVILDGNVEYIDVNDENDGLSVFGVETRFDWYVVQKNAQSDSKTEVVDQNGKTHNVDLSNWKFIPNGMFNTFANLIASPDEEKCNVLYSRSAYGTDKEWTSKEQSETYNVPSVYTVNSESEPEFRYTNKTKKYESSYNEIEVPKLIWSNGRITSVGSIIDEKGEYGLTQFSYGIADDPENLKGIKKAFSTDEFRELMKFAAVNKNRIDYKVLGLFKKDWYKHFV